VFASWPVDGKFGLTDWPPVGETTFDELSMESLASADSGTEGCLHITFFIGCHFILYIGACRVYLLHRVCETRLRAFGDDEGDPTGFEV
jgi:hypothetical protein